MLIQFTKMHGLGNDFVVLDMISQNFSINPQKVIKMADRHLGIGFDQLLLVEAPDQPDVDFKYRIFNADGSEVEQCGNGARCFAKFVRDKHLISKDTIWVSTAKGRYQLNIQDNDQIQVNMGVPILTPAEIPFIAEQQANTYPIQVDANSYQISAVSMGNPHGVLEVDNIEQAAVANLGSKLEPHPKFPEKANIGFMQIVSRQQIKLRVYERGAGETQACGTGACAAVVAGILQGKLDSNVQVQLPSGTLDISWQGQGSDLFMSGPAIHVFEGKIFI